MLRLGSYGMLLQPGGDKDDIWMVDGTEGVKA